MAFLEAFTRNMFAYLSIKVPSINPNVQLIILYLVATLCRLAARKFKIQYTLPKLCDLCLKIPIANTRVSYVSQIS